MSYESFYRYIFKTNGNYRIIRKGEDFGTYSKVEDALYERDRLMAVDWDWDRYMELPETINGYIHITLPPFDREFSFISEDRECWVVRDSGKEQRYRGTYFSEEEANKVARIYNSRVSHKRKAYRVQRRIKGRTKYFGRYKTYEEAQRRVEELEMCDWNADTS